MTGKVTYSAMNSFFGNMEAGMCATVTPPYKNPVNQIVDRNHTVIISFRRYNLADLLPCL